jgi:hypothetical protein
MKGVWIMEKYSVQLVEVRHRVAHVLVRGKGTNWRPDRTELESRIREITCKNPIHFEKVIVTVQASGDSIPRIFEMAG